MSRIVGYAPGVYDMFHIGHLNILRHAKSQCDYLIAGVVSDEMCELAKGRPPIVPLAERVEIVRTSPTSTRRLRRSSPTRSQTWRTSPFDMIFKGDDWRGTAKGQRLEREFAEVGVEVVYFPYTVHTSSSMLRKALSYSFADERVSSY